MKFCIILAAILFVSSCFQMEPPTLNQQTVKAVQAIFTGIYPESHLPSNSKIYLRGDNCNLTWTKGVLLNKTSTNTWTTSMLCPTDTKISVKLLVNDSNWMMGANHVFTISSSQSNKNITIYPSFNPSINKIYDSSPISSSILGNSRRISIYYPPSYSDNTFKKYELLILHDGQNMFDPSKAAFGVAVMVQNATNTLIAQGKIKEVIIVGIWNTNARIDQYTYCYDSEYKQGGKGDLYLDFIEKQLIPKLKNQYLVGRILDNQRVSIGGMSLGGLISCYATYTRPTVYKNAICMSSSFWWNNQDFVVNIVKKRSYQNSISLYLDSGDSGSGQDNKQSTDDTKAALLAKGYTLNKNLFYYLDKGAEHNQYYWGRRFHIPMSYLFAVLP